MADTKYVGKTTRSKEGARHVTGRGLYTDDFILPGMLHAVVLRSPHAHARLVSVDSKHAEAAPGGLAVITPQATKRKSKPLNPVRYPAVLMRPIPEYATAMDMVRYVGEPVAAVAARKRGQAEDSMELISVEYDPLPAVVDTAEAIRPAAALLFEELESNLAWKGSLHYGDVPTAFKQADKIVKEKLKIHRYSSA